MTSNEIYKNYLKALGERTVLENKIEDFIEKWKNGDTTISNATVQKTVDKGYERLEELKKIEEELHTEHIAQVQKEKDKKSADINVQHNLGVRPTDTEIIDGVLSSNANASYLIGQQKTPEQLESERIALLNDIKSRVMNHEISLAEASKLTNDVNTAYGFYNNQSEEMLNNNGMHK